MNIPCFRNRCESEKLTSCVSGALFPVLAITGMSGLLGECLSVVSAFDLSSQM